MNLLTFFTSKKQEKCFEVNRRVVSAMRSIGKGHSGAKKFCAYMNMPPPSKPKPFQKNSKTITKHVKLIARKSMSDVAEEIRILKKVNDDEVRGGSRGYRAYLLIRSDFSHIVYGYVIVYIYNV